MSSPPVESEIPVIVKRGRGRPRKTPEELKTPPPIRVAGMIRVRLPPEDPTDEDLNDPIFVAKAVYYYKKRLQALRDVNATKRHDKYEREQEMNTLLAVVLKTGDRKSRAYKAQKAVADGSAV